MILNDGTPDSRQPGPLNQILDQYFGISHIVRRPDASPEQTQQCQESLTSATLVRVLESLLGDITHIRHALAYSDAMIISATLLMVYEGDYAEKTESSAPDTEQQPQDEHASRTEQDGVKDDFLYTVRLMNFGFAPCTKSNVEGVPTRSRISLDRLDALATGLQRRLEKLRAEASPALCECE